VYNAKSNAHPNFCAIQISPAEFGCLQQHAIVPGACITQHATLNAERIKPVRCKNQVQLEHCWLLATHCLLLLLLLQQATCRPHQSQHHARLLLCPARPHTPLLPGASGS
jgi:hypothetical protein